MHSPLARTDGLSHAARLVFALASGLAVANVYYAQPLIDAIADSAGLDHAVAGAIISATQIGYFFGLLLIVPHGDIMDRRRLLLWQTALLGAALLIPALVSGAGALLVGFGAVGLLSVIAQTFVAYAADLASEQSRGRAIGTVTTGIILGILLARTVSGALADLAGWRSVYAASAIVTFGLLPILAWVIPPDRRAHPPIRYGSLVGSTLALFRSRRELRIRATLAFLIFTAITMLWTPMVLPLRAPPLSLTHSQVGLFGLVGAVGALGASLAGRVADRGLAERMTGIGLALMLASWLPVALLAQSLGWLVIGVIVIDFALQSVHVSNQSLLYREGASARSRLTAAYMLAYSTGCATGSIGSTLVFEAAGWTGVCLAGSAISAAAIGFWAWRTRDKHVATTKPTQESHNSCANEC
jgi:predicted MFS family arabinose efflux permease